MLTGFYNINTVQTNQLRRFFKDALMLSNFVIIESKYTEGNKWRGRDDKYTISDYMKMVSKLNHNTCVDRSIQHYIKDPDGNVKIMPGCDKGEVGFKLHERYDKEWHQISFEMSLPNLKKLTENYGLEMN